jgi:hypothetical protein
MATSLLELVRARRAELEQAQPGSSLTDEKRVWAILALARQAELGDADAQARMAGVRRLFDQVRCQQAPDAAEGP